MPFITQAELNTHLYDEQVGEIVRDDAAIAPASIDAAIVEMKGYLSAYDRAAIFNATGSNRNALILLFCKDIAVWHLICLSTPDIEYKLREERYNRAIQWLRDVATRKIFPELPMVALPEGETAPTAIGFGSNSKRNKLL